jgi:hypothetical protein
MPGLSLFTVAEPRSLKPFTSKLHGSAEKATVRNFDSGSDNQ